MTRSHPTYAVAGGSCRDVRPGLDSVYTRRSVALTQTIPRPTPLSVLAQCEGANFVVFVYDVTDASSLEALGEWIPRLQVIWITCCVSFCLLGFRPRRALHSIFTPLAAQALYDASGSRESPVRGIILGNKTDLTDRYGILSPCA